MPCLGSMGKGGNGRALGSHSRTESRDSNSSASWGKAGISPDLSTPDQESGTFWTHLEILPGFYQELVFPCPRGCCSWFLVSCLLWHSSPLGHPSWSRASLPVPSAVRPDAPRAGSAALPSSGSLAKELPSVRGVPGARAERQPSVSPLCHPRAIALLLFESNE